MADSVTQPGTPGFVAWDRPSPLLDAIGGFERHELDPARFGFTVGASKVNSRGLLHAGVVAAIADAAIGHRLAALLRSRGRDVDYVTVDLSCKYLGVARLGDWVDGAITPAKLGRRLAAGTAALSVADRPIAVVTALFVPAEAPAAT